MSLRRRVHLLRQQLSHALRHRWRSAANRVGEIKIFDRQFEGIGAHRPFRPERCPGRGFNHAKLVPRHADITDHLGLQLRLRVIGQINPQHRRERANNFPVLTRFTGRKCRLSCQLRSPFSIHIERGLFGIGRTGENDIGAVRATVTMMPLINYEAVAQLAGVDFIRA